MAGQTPARCRTGSFRSRARASAGRRRVSSRRSGPRRPNRWRSHERAEQPEGHQRRRDDAPAHAEKAADAAEEQSPWRAANRARGRAQGTRVRQRPPAVRKSGQRISSREEIPSREVGACPIMRGAEGDWSAGSGPLSSSPSLTWVRKTISLPGRSGASRTSRTLNP